MYFNGQLAIDPSQETLVEKVRPTKAFGRMLYYLTGGWSVRSGRTRDLHRGGHLAAAQYGPALYGGD